MWMFSEIADLVKLWDANWVHLTGDHLYTTRWQIGNLDMHLSSTELQNLRLLEIEYILKRNGRSPQHFSSMPLPFIQAIVHEINQLIIDELDYDTNLETPRF